MDRRANATKRAAQRRAAAPVKPIPRPPADYSREAWGLVIQFFKAAKQSFMAEFGLTQAQAQLLMHLDPERPATMTGVASMLGCDASNVTGLVDRLEERGLTERRSAEGDRRVKMIAVTAKGAKQRHQLLELWLEAPAPIKALPQRDLKELLRILRKAAGS